MKKVTVIGAGTMGNGIAHVFALHEAHVNLVDISDEVLSGAIDTIEHNLDRMLQKQKISREQKTQALKHISTFTSIQESQPDPDLIIEAVTESLPTKLKVFQEMDAFAPPGCILASNTSSISVTKLASVTKRPEKVVGMHFMNPVPVMKLVEIIRGLATDEATVEEIVHTTREIEKEPVVVKDYPGFVSNRILMPMINEAIYVLYEGIAGVDEIDTIFRLGMSHPMGPLQLADLIGLDVCQSILKILYKDFGNPKYAPCPLLNNMVTAGKLGKKSGEGFYKYSG